MKRERRRMTDALKAIMFVAVLLVMVWLAGACSMAPLEIRRTQDCMECGIDLIERAQDCLGCGIDLTTWRR